MDLSANSYHELLVKAGKTIPIIFPYDTPPKR